MLLLGYTKQSLSLNARSGMSHTEDVRQRGSIGGASDRDKVRTPLPKSHRPRCTSPRTGQAGSAGSTRSPRPTRFGSVNERSALLPSRQGSEPPARQGGTRTRETQQYWSGVGPTFSKKKRQEPKEIVWTWFASTVNEGAGSRGEGIIRSVLCRTSQGEPATYGPGQKGW